MSDPRPLWRWEFFDDLGLPFNLSGCTVTTRYLVSGVEIHQHSIEFDEFGNLVQSDGIEAVDVTKGLLIEHMPHATILSEFPNGTVATMVTSVVNLDDFEWLFPHEDIRVVSKASPPTDYDPETDIVLVLDSTYTSESSTSQTTPTYYVLANEALYQATVPADV